MDTKSHRTVQMVARRGLLLVARASGTAFASRRPA